MNTLLSVLFYLWVVITVLLVLMWIVRRQAGQNLTFSEDHQHRSLKAEAARKKAAKAETGETAPKTPSATEGPDAGPAVQAAGSAADGKPADSAESSTDGKLAESAESPADDESTADQSTSTVQLPAPLPLIKVEPAETEPEIERLLTGLNLPLDLTPVNGSVTVPDRHAVFLSSHDDAEEVGTAFADELARLGYDIKPRGYDQAIASRGNGSSTTDEVLSMKIVPSAARVTVRGIRRYPTAGDNDVAIEVWIGLGEPPSDN